MGPEAAPEAAADPQPARVRPDIRKRGSGRWQAGYLHHGQLHWAPATFPTKDSGVAWLAAERKLIDLGTWTPPAARVVKATARKLALGLRDPVAGAAQHLAAHQGQLRVPPAAQYLSGAGGFAAGRADTRRRARVVAGLGTEYRTRNAQAYGVLQAVLNAAVDDGLIDRSPARIRGGAAVKHAKRSVILLDPEELVALAEAMPDALRLAVLLGRAGAGCGAASCSR